jgi:TRAP-type transport system periplasmic protein
MLTHGYLVGLNYNNVYIIANKAAFDGLSPEDQEKVRAAAVETAAWNTETMRNEDAEIIERLGKDRMKIVTPGAEDVAKAEADMKPYWDEWAASRGDDAVKLLAEIRQALGR